MASESKMIMLRSYNNEIFEIEEAVAFKSQTIKRMIEHDCADRIIPLPKISSKILAKVIKYCTKHATSNETNKTAEKKELESFDAEFVKVDKNVLFGLISAADYLNIKSLSDLTIQALADTLEEKTDEEIRDFFDIEKMRKRRNI